MGSRRGTCYLAREVQLPTQGRLPGTDPVGILQVTVAVVEKHLPFITAMAAVSQRETVLE